MSCYNCPNRKLGCHDTCEQYQKEKANKDKLRKIEQEARATYRAKERKSFAGTESRLRGKRGTRVRRYGELE